MNPNSLLAMNEEQQRRLLLDKARGGIPGLPAGLITNQAMNLAPPVQLPQLRNMAPAPPTPAQLAAAQNMTAGTEGTWGQAMALPALTMGGRPGPMQSMGQMTAAGAAGAPPAGPPPMMPGAPAAAAAARQNPAWYDAMTSGIVGGSIGALGQSPWGVGVGAGLGALAAYMKRRRDTPRPMDEKLPAVVPMRTGGLVKPRPKISPLATVVRMAAGGAAKERLGYPRTSPPKKGANPFSGKSKGGGKATRGLNFKVT